MPISYKKLKERYEEKCNEVTRVNRRVADWRRAYSSIESNLKVAREDIAKLKKQIKRLRDKLSRQEDTT